MGKRLKAIRKARGLTCHALGELLGYSWRSAHQAIVMIEHGHWEYPYFERLCDVLGVRPADILYPSADEGSAGCAAR